MIGMIKRLFDTGHPDEILEMTDYSGIELYKVEVTLDPDEIDEIEEYAYIMHSISAMHELMKQFLNEKQLGSNEVRIKVKKFKL